MGTLFVGNGVVFPIVAYYLRHVTLTPATWRAYLRWSLVVGVVVPLLVVVAVCVVNLVARNPDRPPLTVTIFALVWSAPGLVTCHNAFSDLRRGPVTTVEQVKSIDIVKEDVGQANAVHVWRTCVVTFDDGARRRLDRYSVKYATEDPCHGIAAGDRVRMEALPHVDETLSVDRVR